jgi:hypothetical protein
LHNPKDAIKVHHAIASGEIYLGAPKMRSLKSDDDDVLARSGISLTIPPETDEDARLECYGVTAAGVYAVSSG